MFGTEIESAYSGASYSGDSGMFRAPTMSTPVVASHDDVDAVRKESARQEAIRQIAMEQDHDLMAKETDMTRADMTRADMPEFAFPRSAVALPVVPNDIHVDTDHRIKNLERAMSQKLAQDAQGSSVGIFERYASKRRDVAKLIIMALTVLLALSAHHAISDLLRTYINNNDVSRNRETALRFGYPIAVFGLLWSLKVFNK